MEKEYRDLQSSSIENGIVFYGLECCEPNYIFKGNNIRENYVIHYIRKGCGTFSSAGRPLVKLKQETASFYLKAYPASIRLMKRTRGNTAGSDFQVSGPVKSSPLQAFQKKLPVPDSGH